MDTAKIGDTLVLGLRAGFVSQGHNLTGRGVASISYTVTEQPNATHIQVFALDYVATTDTGVPYNRIPYNPGSGRKTSLYIQGLREYARQRFGQNDAEALQTAFKIAYVQKIRREGMSTIASQRFSRTGRRTGWVQEAYLEVLPQLISIISADVVTSAILSLSTIPGR